MSLPDDVLKRWEEAARHYWDHTSSRCHRCRWSFQTGDVCLVFGDLENAAARKTYYCSRCGYQELLSFRQPSGTAVFVEARQRAMKLADLPAEDRERLLEGFRIVDQIHDTLANLAAQAGQLENKEGEG